MIRATPVVEGRSTRWGLVAFVALVMVVLSPMLIVFQLTATAVLATVWLLRPKWRGVLAEPLLGMLLGCIPYIVAALIAASTQ